MAAQPPPELAQAINAAASKYQFPADLLAGIWREESGGSFPNPYANSSGYGGLFGTRNWNASTQAQADLAGSILAEGLRQSRGNIAEALSYYNSGKLTGGYTSVPGETSFGNVRAPTAVPSDPGDYTAPPRPGGGQDVSIVSDLGSVLGAVVDPLGIFSVGKGLLGSAGDVAGALKGFFAAALWLLDPKTYLRGAEIGFGFILILFGLYYFGKTEGSADVDPVDLARNPGQLIRGAGTGAQKSAERARSGSLLGKTAKKVASVTPAGREAKLASKLGA
jgi:hypothetical protein